MCRWKKQFFFQKEIGNWKVKMSESYHYFSDFGPRFYYIKLGKDTSMAEISAESIFLHIVLFWIFSLKFNVKQHAEKCFVFRNFCHEETLSNYMAETWSKIIKVANKTPTV